MKKPLFLLLLFCWAALSRAVINIKDGGLYRISCQKYSAGSVVLGSLHHAAPFLYYTLDLSSVPDDAWWVVTSKGDGYTLRNAVTDQYMVYKEGRLTNDNGQYTAKGIQLSDTDNDENAVWIFSETADGQLIIKNAGGDRQYFNLRTDGSYLLGTYSSASTENGHFQLYDKNDNPVVRQDGDSGTEDAVSGYSGENYLGEYWERTGLAMPVVLTTDVSSPVLYRIRNARYGQYVTVADGALSLGERKTDQFYFVSEDSGVKVYTQNHQFVTIADDGLLVGDKNTEKAGGFSFGFSRTSENTGYTIFSSSNENKEHQLYWQSEDSDETLQDLYLGDFNVRATFVFYSSDVRHHEYLLSHGITFNDDQPLEGVQLYLDSIRIGGKALTYDKHDKCFYLPLSEKTRETGTLSAPISVKWAKSDAGYSLRIEKASVDEKGNVVIKNVQCESPYTLSIVKNGSEKVASAPLNLTFLPIVEMTMPSCNGNTYTEGTFRVTDADQAGYDSTFVAAFRYRGASAQLYPKKSYAIKLRDGNGNSVDREFFNLREDNNWILDAMYIDGACMRNRVSTDLWNDFSTKPYHCRAGWEKKARTGTRGRFVEVFLNGRYHGLYCMTEKMDRKQLKLKKYVEGEKLSDGTALSSDTIHGTLYKSTQWSYEVFMGYDRDNQSYPRRAPRSYNNDSRSESWASYEIKYPDYETQKIDWGPLWNAVNLVATADDDVFDEEVKTYFDYPVVRDYYLFIELMIASDNRGKNMYFFNYDQKSPNCTKMIGIAPWNLDGTWGIKWSGDRIAADFEHELATHALFYRLSHSAKWDWSNDLKTRYAELRSSEFSLSSLESRFLDYLDLFEMSGADIREQNRWNGHHTDIAGDVAYIRQWIADRLEILDREYGYVPIVDGVQTPVTDEVFVKAEGGRGCITLSVTRPATARIYTISGQLLRTVRLSQPTVEVGGLSAGVYIVEGQKVVVK